MIANFRNWLIFNFRLHYRDPRDFKELVMDDFTALIDKLYPASETPDPLKQEATWHAAYGMNRRLAFRP